MDSTRNSRAAVLFEQSKPLEIVTTTLMPPQAGEVEVAVGAVGICHSDIAVQSGELKNPTPVVLGHEGAGTIVAVGEGVTDHQIGDRVAMSWLAQCESCYYCLYGQPQLCSEARRAFAKGTLLDGSTRVSYEGRPVNQMAGLGALAERCIIPAASAVGIPAGLPIESAALLGCAVLTGWGAAVNTAAVRPGDSVAVLGCGGIGISAIQGARTAGAGQIIAIDLSEQRLERALGFGATTVQRAGDGLESEIRRLTGGRGVDVAIEAVGSESTINDAVSITRRGGRVVLVGASDSSVNLAVPAFEGLVMTEKIIRGSLYGSSRVRRDIPILGRQYVSGSLLLDEMVTQRFSLDEVNDAFAYTRAGSGLRAVVVMA